MLKMNPNFVLSLIYRFWTENLWGVTLVERRTAGEVLKQIEETG